MSCMILICKMYISVNKLMHQKVAFVFLCLLVMPMASVALFVAMRDYLIIMRCDL